MILIIFIKALKNTTQLKYKILIIGYDMIANMLINKKLNPVVTELFIRGRKLNISLVFITISFCSAKKYWTKFYALFYYENSKQMTTSTNCI